MLRASIIAAFALSILTSCGGSKNNRETEPSPSSTDYSKLERSELSAGPLKEATSEELERFLKNGIRLNAYQIYTSPTIDNDNFVAEAGFSAGDATARYTEQASTSKFSQTNTHVKGIDESDFVKYDGTYLYVSTHPEYIWGQEKPNAQIKIYQTAPAQATAEEIGSITVPNENWGEVSELYLIENPDSPASDLATIRNSWSVIATAEPTFTDSFIDIWQPLNDAVQLNTYDISSPDNPVLDWSVEIDGYLQGSRKVGDFLYLTLTYWPQLDNIHYYGNEDVQDRNEKTIASAPLADLLPQITLDNGSPQPLFADSKCLIPSQTNALEGSTKIVSLVAINLSERKITSTQCINTVVDGIYGTNNALYVGGSKSTPWRDASSFTSVHKFELNNGQIAYRSTGTVPGTLGWTDSAFRMSEHQSILRMLTTQRDSAQINHKLYLLKDAPDKQNMEVIAELPNTNHPTAIGKENEDVYAVRFFGDLAYVVTFERTDPLYVINLSNPLSPFIEGSLEIPGFSTYLHPLDNNYILGLGNHVEQGQTSGVKISLFDVSNRQTPIESATAIIGQGNTWTPALYDLHAFTYQHISSDQFRFSLPISTFTENYAWENEALHMFEVNGLSSLTPSLNKAGEFISEQASGEKAWPSSYGIGRSVLHDQAVYYIHGNQLISGFWGESK